MAISLYKMFGSPLVSGIALANKSYLEKGVIVDQEYIQYANVKDQLTLFGSRPSLPILFGLNICDQLDLSNGASKLKEIIDHNI